MEVDGSSDVKGSKDVAGCSGAIGTSGVNGCSCLVSAVFSVALNFFCAESAAAFTVYGSDINDRISAAIKKYTGCFFICGFLPAIIKNI